MYNMYKYYIQYWPKLKNPLQDFFSKQRLIYIIIILIKFFSYIM